MAMAGSNGALDEPMVLGQEVVPRKDYISGKNLAILSMMIGLVLLGGMHQASQQPATTMAFMSARSPMQNQVANQVARSPMQKLSGCPFAVIPRGATITQAQVLLGSDTGGLVFVPDSLSVKAGDTVEFKNNAGFPHNIIFDEDSVPEGVNAEAISKEDYLNAPGETHSVKFEKAGTYGYYCQPHQGAGMKGKIIVQ